MSTLRFFSMLRILLMVIGAMTVMRVTVSILLPESAVSLSNPSIDAKTSRVISEAAAVSPLEKHVPEFLPKVYNSAVRVLFLIGLEGTGHHVYHELVPETPAGEVLRETKSFGTVLHGLLFRQWKIRTKGLWSATCRWDDGREEPPPNVAAITDDLVKTLRNLDASFRAKNRTVNFHLNGRLERGFGHLAYPNYREPCRGMSYPNVDLLYKACDRAEVDCQHIHIYRDPHSVIKSTNINRDINTDILGSIHLYTTMLQIIYFQLLSNPSRMFACWNYDRVPSDSPRLGEALMFQDQRKWKKVASEIYKSRDPLTEEERLKIVPSELQPYMDSMIRVHEQVVELCHRQMSQQGLGVNDEQ